jgi:hypothetical protein
MSGSHPADAKWLGQRAALACAALGMSAATHALPAAAGFEANREIVLVCTVAGAGYVRPAASAAQICSAVKRRLDARLGRVTRATSALPATGNAIRIEIRIPGNRSASAAVTTIARGKSTRWPEFAVDVMDRPLGMGEIEQLAGDIAQTISQVR